MNSGQTVHFCIDKTHMLPLRAIGWIWDERPLNLDAGHKICPYCELDVQDESFIPATQEQIDVLNLHYVGQQKKEIEA